MSQGAGLARSLSRIGYPGGSELNAESLEWMFEDEACLPFLEWFCNNIDSSNVISDDELKRFNELVQSGEGVLEGDMLEEALSCAQGFEEEIPSDTLRDEIKGASKAVESMNRRLQQLVFQRNKLSLHQARVTHQLTQIGAVEKEAKQKYKKCLETSHADSKQVDLAIAQLVKAVSDLTTLHVEEKGDQCKPFLSQLNSGDYYNSEEKFTSELTAYTRKQFFEGFADMAGRDDKSRYELLEISDPTSLLIRGESEDVILNDCKELARLQAVYAVSERKRINAEATSQGVMAAVELAEEKNQSMMRHHHMADVDTLRNHLSEVQSSLTRIKDEISQLTEKSLQGIVQELAELQATKILRGDYDLKIARQDYFTSKQDQVINQLLLQRSRYEFLSMALEVEGHRHRDTHRIFSAVESGLQHSVNGLQERTTKMSDPTLQPIDPGRGTIDSRDQFIGRLYQLLDPKDCDENSRNPMDSDWDTRHKQGPLFHTYAQVLEWTNELVDTVHGLESSLITADRWQEDTLRQLEHNLEQCQKVAYGRAPTAGGLPQLSPQRLADALIQLEEVLSTLEQSIKDVIKDVETKKKVLRSDNLKAMERDLFVCFFTDSARLRRAVAELAARVDAQIVSTR